MNWKIVDYSGVDKSNIAGRFTLVIGPIQIRGWTHFKKNGSEWVSGPQQEYLKGGGKKFYP